MLNAKNGRLRMKTGEMDYIRFGTGKNVMVMLPGVGDGLKTVKGTALPFAFLYRTLAREFTVYVFSRRVNLAPHTSTREMAADLNLAMDAQGLKKTAVVGVSQGGMIAQWLTLDYPERVGKLVLTVSTCRPNPTVREVIGRWMTMAERNDYRGILLDTAERSYTPQHWKKVRLAYGFLSRFGKPNSMERFRIQAESCLTHDSYSELHRISCPTLVIGGTEDRIVTGAASEELAERIPGSELKLYEGLGHGLYEEAPDFLKGLAAFCGRG